MAEILTLSLARRRDARRIAEMARDLIEVGLGWSWQAARVQRQIERADSLVVVARTAEQVVGFGIMRYAAEEGHLLLFAVDPTCRRQGVGRRLLAWLEACAREAGLRRLALEVRARNRAAQAFYASEGFEVEARVRGYYRRAGRVEDALRMRKVLEEELSTEGLEERLLALLGGTSGAGG